MEKKIEHEMKAQVISGFIGFAGGKPKLKPGNKLRVWV